MMNVMIVTGASSGMGKEFVKQIDKKFPKVNEIWLIARRKEELEALAGECYHKCRVMPLDITNPLAVEVFIQYLEKLNPKIKMLINCAGYGIYSPFDKTSMEEQTGMIDLNCKALTAITHASIPYMASDSRVIQLASSAAFLPQPQFAVYAATKSYVLSFTKALNEEYRKKGIHFTAVCPGPVNTEFFDRAEVGYGTLSIKKFVMADKEAVVKKALWDSRNKKEVSVYGIAMKAFDVVAKIYPHKFILWIRRFMK